MFSRAVLLLILAVLTTGCDKLTGAADQKIYDAEAIGYACRVTAKQPEDCMKENDTQSPSSILTGWKAADKDIVSKKLDPSMGKDPASAEQPASAPAATGDAQAGEKGEADPASSEKQNTKAH